MRTQACLVRRACAGGPHLAGGTPASGQGRRGHGGNASCRGRQDRGPEACAWKRAHGPRRQGRGRAQAGPDAEPWAEVNCPGDGARRLSSRSHKKGSPALGTRGCSRHRYQTLEGRKPPLKPEASAPARTRGHVAVAGGAEAGEKGRRFRKFLREGEPQGEGENRESGWVKTNMNTQGPSGKGRGAHSGDCEMNTGVGVNPGRAAVLQLSRPAWQGLKTRTPFRGRVLECWTH